MATITLPTPLSMENRAEASRTWCKCHQAQSTIESGGTQVGRTFAEEGTMDVFNNITNSIRNIMAIRMAFED